MTITEIVTASLSVIAVIVSIWVANRQSHTSKEIEWLRQMYAVQHQDRNILIAVRGDLVRHRATYENLVEEYGAPIYPDTPDRHFAHGKSRMDSYARTLREVLTCIPVTDDEDLNESIARLMASLEDYEVPEGSATSGYRRDVAGLCELINLHIDSVVRSLDAIIGRVNLTLKT